MGRTAIYRHMKRKHSAAKPNQAGDPTESSHKLSAIYHQVGVNYLQLVQLVGVNYICLRTVVFCLQAIVFCLRTVAFCLRTVAFACKPSYFACEPSYLPASHRILPASRRILPTNRNMRNQRAYLQCFVFVSQVVGEKLHRHSLGWFKNVWYDMSHRYVCMKTDKFFREKF